MHDVSLSLLPVEGHRDEHGLRQGWFRFFNAEGELVATAHYRDDLLHGQVISMHGGQRVAELGYRDGLADGAYRRRVAKGTYALEGVCWEEGTFTAGVPCNVLWLRDEQGNVLLERDFGQADESNDDMNGPGRINGAAGDADVTSSWFRIARSLQGERRYAEALAAIARGVGAGGNPDILRATLARVAAPVTAEEAERRATAVRASGSRRVLLAALLRGAEPSAVLRRLALVDRDEASIPLLQAAIALQEWPLSPILGRALRNLRDPSATTQAVLDDAKTLAMSHGEEARVLRALAGRKQAGRAKDERGDRPTMRRFELSEYAAASA